MYSVLKLTSPMLPSLYLMIRFNVAFNMWCRCNTLMRITQWFSLWASYSMLLWHSCIQCQVFWIFLFFFTTDLEWEQHWCPLDPASLKHHFVKLESHQTGPQPRWRSVWPAMHRLPASVHSLLKCSTAFRNSDQNLVHMPLLLCRSKPIVLI